jgi:very-short-patch-repair endonuclease
LIRDDSRNLAICFDVVENVQNGRAPLVLTERVDHLQTLAGGLQAKGLDVVCLQGGMGNRALKSALARAAESVPGRVLLATGRFIGEGFDNPRLDSLFLTMPVSWRGTIAQYVGRLHRLHEHKREVRVYDYADLDVPILSRMFDRRCRAYEAAGYSISLPASAAPGWPASVQLPADGHWKHQYAASVRRLLRDGVDEPLAELFSTITGPLPSAEPDTPRVRSASEAFLLRRLQSLPETRDRFRLNAHLPIPFCQEGHMEVDFLDPASRLVIELDGSQHLADREAYRRDRRKDALLQEYGYVVLRFLAEDLGIRLDSVLDEILRALARRAEVSGK